MAQRKRLRAVAYLRVSTERQADIGLGLDVQRECIRKWAKQQNARIVAWLADEGESGAKPADERPALRDALRMLAKEEADAFICSHLDRLARNLEIQELVLAQAWKSGASVWTCSDGLIVQDDPEDPTRTAMRKVMGVFAELERGLIAARMRAGRRHKAEQGGFAYGSPPFGTQAVEEAKGKERTRALAPHEKEQETIQRALELRREGLSLRAIADVLEQEGRPSKRGGRWHPTTLARVLGRVESPRGGSRGGGRKS